MKKIVLLLILLLPVCRYILTAQNNDWQVMSNSGDSGSSLLLIKQEDNITYVIDSTLDMTKRERFVADTKKYIAKNLGILHEPEFNESVWIILIPDRNEMYKRFDTKRLSMMQEGGVPDTYAIVFVYDSIHSPLNRELMLLMAAKTWGEIQDPRLFWLKEGLATYATPAADSCDGHTLEERYAWFSQNGQQIDLLKFPTEEERLPYKIARNQSAYIVEYLLEHDGVDRVKQLWQGKMVDFEKIFGTTFEDMQAQINTSLSNKYTTPMTFNPDDFNRDCINPQPDDWFSAYNPTLSNLALNRMVTKKMGNLKFTLDSALSLSERDEVIAKTKELIAKHLALINESPFNDSIHLVLVPTRNDMKNLLGAGIGGNAFPKGHREMTENTIYAVHGGIHNALGHEIMHMVSYLKWGCRSPIWLDEGLATWSSPETINCDGYTFEERYVYFLQNGKLLVPNASMEFISGDSLISHKIFYSQTAYIVSYLLQNYGIEKFKLFWTKGMEYFEKLYDLNFEDMILKINHDLNEKYPDPINFSWEAFCEDCIK